MTQAGTSPAEGPLVVAPRMGYGHLRAAQSVADALGVSRRRSDAPPLASPAEQKTWEKIRRFYERLSRQSQRKVSGLPAHTFLEWITAIPPLHPERDLSAPTRGAETMERFAAQGLCRTIAQHLEETGRPLVSTYYAEAIAADRARRDRVFCVITDTDVNRVWAPLRPGRTGIQYCAPTHRVVRRMLAYGVPEENVHETGFPLPIELVGEDGGVLRRNLAARLERLDPRQAFRERIRSKGLEYLLPRPRATSGQPPLLVFAVGGAGAQTAIVRRFLPGLAPRIGRGELRLALVAGVRAAVEKELTAWVLDAGLGGHLGQAVRVLVRPDFTSYYRAFSDLLAEADLLWTKPGELVFYAALGLPLVLSPPVGVQERSNARWVLDRGAAVPQGPPEHAHSWLFEKLEDGSLAGAAWSGFLRLRYDGSTTIRRLVEAS